MLVVVFCVLGAIFELKWDPLCLSSVSAAQNAWEISPQSAFGLIKKHDLRERQFQIYYSKETYVQVAPNEKKKKILPSHLHHPQPAAEVQNSCWELTHYRV